MKFGISSDGLTYYGTTSIDSDGLRDTKSSLFSSELIIYDDKTNLNIQNIYLRYYQSDKSNVKIYIPNHITVSYDFKTITVSPIVIYTDSRVANIVMLSTRGYSYDSVGLTYYQKITYFRYSSLTFDAYAYLMSSKYLALDYSIVIITNFNTTGISYILPLSYSSYVLINYKYVIYSLLLKLHYFLIEVANELIYKLFHNF
jgi:hypothetical protein